MNLWCDKYRPKTFHELDYQLEQATSLQTIVASGDFQHFLIYGPTGSGKKTRINCLLHELYGDGVQSLRTKTLKYETPSGEEIEIRTTGSRFHTEVDLSGVRICTRIVIQELIKTIVQAKPINTKEKPIFKVIVIVGVDKLIANAQYGLLRAMERYRDTFRFILCSSATSCIISAVQTRCSPIPVAAPTIAEIRIVLNKIATSEGIFVPIGLVDRIAEQSQHNLRDAVLILQAYIEQEIPLSSDQHIIKPDWEVYLNGMHQLKEKQKKSQRVNPEKNIRILMIVAAAIFMALFIWHIINIFKNHEQMKANSTIQNAVQSIMTCAATILNAAAFGRPFKCAAVFVVGFVVAGVVQILFHGYFDWTCTFFFLLGSLITVFDYFHLYYQDVKERKN